MQRSCAAARGGGERSPGRDMHYEQSLEAWGTEIMPACGQGRDWAASRLSHGSVVDRHSRECTPVPCGQGTAPVAEYEGIAGMKQGARGEGRSKQGANANRGQWGCTGAGTHSGPELLEPAGPSVEAFPDGTICDLDRLRPGGALRVHNDWVSSAVEVGGGSDLGAVTCVGSPRSGAWIGAGRGKEECEGRVTSCWWKVVQG